MTAPVMTLADFLLARIAEDEASARGRQMQVAAQFGKHDPVSDRIAGQPWPARVLAESEAKRRIVEMYIHLRSPAVFDPMGAHVGLGRSLRLLALPYAEHPDYGQKWRP